MVAHALGLDGLFVAPALRDEQQGQEHDDRKKMPGIFS
jgi:hypothetical protein